MRSLRIIRLLRLRYILWMNDKGGFLRMGLDLKVHLVSKNTDTTVILSGKIMYEVRHCWNPYTTEIKYVFDYFEQKEEGSPLKWIVDKTRYEVEDDSIAIVPYNLFKQIYNASAVSTDGVATLPDVYDELGFYVVIEHDGFYESTGTVEFADIAVSNFEALIRQQAETDESHRV